MTYPSAERVREAFRLAPDAGPDAVARALGCPAAYVRRVLRRSPVRGRPTRRPGATPGQVLDAIDRYLETRWIVADNPHVKAELLEIRAALASGTWRRHLPAGVRAS